MDANNKNHRKITNFMCMNCSKVMSINYENILKHQFEFCTDYEHRPL